MTASQTNQARELGWTDAHEHAAELEGWGIWHCPGDASCPWQTQRIDDASEVAGAPQLDADQDAWRLLLRGSSSHHAAALRIIKALSPVEYERIMEFADAEELGCACVPGFTNAEMDQGPERVDVPVRREPQA